MMHFRNLTTLFYRSSGLDMFSLGKTLKKLSNLNSGLDA